MNEPRKMALTIAIVMAIGMLVLGVEWLWEGGCRWLALAGLGFVVLVVLLSVHFAHARDLDGRYTNSELKPWFDQLKSGKGLCCSDADGSAISDADWETAGGHYRVRIDGEWVAVPDEAVITEPNRAGRTMVWPLKGYLGTSIRCFMPGSMG
jgi:hypothetical protein